MSVQALISRDFICGRWRNREVNSMSMKSPVPFYGTRPRSDRQVGTDEAESGSPTLTARDCGGLGEDQNNDLLCILKLATETAGRVRKENDAHRLRFRRHEISAEDANGDTDGIAGIKDDL